MAESFVKLRNGLSEMKNAQDELERSKEYILYLTEEVCTLREKYTCAKKENATLADIVQAVTI